jgi:hypothetical protein
VQWWLFIGIAVGGWILLIRRELAERRAREQSSEGSAAQKAETPAT